MLYGGVVPEQVFSVHVVYIVKGLVGCIVMCGFG